MGSVGYDLLEANDGAAGLAMVTEHRPDLILMDIQLPVMD
jgi:CheY-like chemotaxis protein